MEYLVGFIVLLGVLIFFHELGHFLVAKAVGVKVLKFSLGFPPAVVKRQWGETEYILSWIPLGGYVKLLGEDPESEQEVAPEEQQRSYSNQPVLYRMAIIFAGPFFNYVLAVLLLCGGYLAGLPVPVSELGKVVDGTPAYQAGFKPGDRVLAINGKPIWRWDEMRSMIEKSPGEQVLVTIERDGQQSDITVVPALSEHKNELGDQVGRIGVVPSGKTVTLGFADSISEGCRLAGHLTKMVVVVLGKLVTGSVSPKELSGPITIMQASGESLKAGLFSYIFLMSYISINLAIINLLPIPILDGGHLLFLFLEAIIRRPITGKIRETAFQVGLLMLVFLMVLVFYNDFYRIWTKGWTLVP